MSGGGLRFVVDTCFAPRACRGAWSKRSLGFLRGSRDFWNFEPVQNRKKEPPNIGGGFRTRRTANQTSLALIPK